MELDHGSPKNLRILILGNAAPFRIGGAEVQVRRLADEFCRRGHDITIAGYAMPRVKEASDYSWHSVRLRASGRARSLRALSFAISLGSFLIRHRSKFDVIYGRILGESILVAALLKNLGLIRHPLVASSGCAGKSGDAAALEKLPWSSWLVRILNRACNGINILSPVIANELKSLGLDSKLFIDIPNAVTQFDAAQIGNRDFNARRTFLFVGRLSPQKRVDLLLLAVYRLKKHNHLVRLHIVGDGPAKSELYALAGRLGIAQQVVFHGMVDPASISSYYARHSIFLLGSRDEGQPNALLEAMANAMPAIVCASGGAEYLVDETTGIVCDPDDPDALFIAMSQMLTMPSDQLTKMGAAAWQQVRSRYDLDRVVNQHLDLFEQLIMRSG